MRKIRWMVSGLVLVVAACDDVLDVDPVNELTEDNAIVDATGARAAVAGIYDALQGGSYYSEAFVTFSDLPSDDVEHTGTFSTYGDADANRLTADNSTIEGIWDALYRAVGRANIVIERVPDVPGLEAEEREQMLGEAYFLRALTFHNLVKLWGDSADAGLGVPIPTTVPKSVTEASQIARATTGETYAQILSDLDNAEQRITDESAPRRASLGAVHAIRARVHLYRENWAEAEAATDAVLAVGYTLAPEYSDLFTPDGAETQEDIFKVAFTPVEFSLLGFYYRSRGEGGRQEVAPSATLEGLYTPGDTRLSWNVAYSGPRRFGGKWPTGAGDEDIHVIRLAEVLLIRAEAQAWQGELTDAIASLNSVRERAGLTPLSAEGMTADQVLDAVILERRLELAMEGDRWPDLVRRGRALVELGITDRPAQRLFPIPLNEIDVTNPPLLQNPGY
ncbi:MAG: RagB/SusD family nutrient uptake outer membrane protein [Longimicrobiales bacterium]